MICDDGHRPSRLKASWIIMTAAGVLVRGQLSSLRQIGCYLDPRQQRRLRAEENDPRSAHRTVLELCLLLCLFSANHVLQIRNDKPDLAVARDSPVETAAWPERGQALRTAPGFAGSDRAALRREISVEFCVRLRSGQHWRHRRHSACIRGGTARRTEFGQRGPGLSAAAQQLRASAGQRVQAKAG